MKHKIDGASIDGASMTVTLDFDYVVMMQYFGDSLKLWLDKNKSANDFVAFVMSKEEANAIMELWQNEQEYIARLGQLRRAGRFE